MLRGCICSRPALIPPTWCVPSAWKKPSALGIYPFTTAHRRANRRRNEQPTALPQLTQGVLRVKTDGSASMEYPPLSATPQCANPGRMRLFRARILPTSCASRVQVTATVSGTNHYPTALCPAAPVSTRPPTAHQQQIANALRAH